MKRRRWRRGDDGGKKMLSSQRKAMRGKDVGRRTEEDVIGDC